MRSAGCSCVFSACAVLGQWVLRDVGNRPTARRRLRAARVGSVITAASVSTARLDGFLLGSLVVGFGFGAAFMGALRTLPDAAPGPSGERDGRVLRVAYFAISVPAIGAGVAAVHIGLTSAVTWFGCAVAIVAALVSTVGWFELRPAPRRSSLARIWSGRAA